MIDLEVVQSAFDNMITGAISFAPRLVITILILILGYIVSKIIANIVERIADRLGIDGILARTGVKAGLEKAQISQSAGELLGKFLYWIIFLNFVLIGLENLGLQEAVQPLRDLIAFLPRILIALITLTAGILLAQFMGKAAEAAMRGMGVDFHEEVGQGVNVLLIIMIVIVVLEQLGIDAQILTSIFTNIVTIVVAGLALAFGLGGREVARNVLAGHYAREQYSAGDLITISDQEGFLEGIGTLNAEIRVGDDLLIVPNVRLTGSAVKIREVADNDGKPIEQMES